MSKRDAPSIEVNMETPDDLLMMRHKQAISAASGKFCKPIPTRQMGELYPEYHRRVMAQLQEEAVACQKFMEEAKIAALVEVEKKFPR